MGKASKKKSRRDNRGSRRSNEDLEHTDKKQIGENSSIILTDLNSIDPKKRRSAIVMFKDLLLQNLNNVTVVGKLTTSEILSTLSLRLIDSNFAIRSQAVKCFLIITRCGIKFAEKIVHLGIHETIRRMLEEVALSASSESDEMIDDLLCTVHLLSIHCQNAFLGSADTLMALALSNLSENNAIARKISFSEYLLNCSSDSSAVTARQQIWVNLYEQLCNILSAQQLSHSLESYSDYFLVLLSAVATNLLTSIPTLPHSEPVISKILRILIESLHLQHVLAHTTLPHSADSDAGSLMAIIPSETEIQSDVINSSSIGKYKTLTLKTAADALSRFFTKKERSNDRSESSRTNQSVNSNNDSKCVDFKEQFGEVFNTYFSLCLHTAGQLAAIPLPLPLPLPLAGKSLGSQGSGSDSITATSVPEMSYNNDSAVVDSKSGLDIMSGVCSTGSVSMTNGSNGVIDKMFSSTVSESSSETESNSNIRDLLEAFLNSLCTATDYAALSLSEDAVQGFISDLTVILEVQYSSFCSLSQAAELAASVASGAEDDSEGREEVENVRYLTTSVCECISSIVQHATVGSFMSLGREESSAIVQRLALILCRCANSTDTDISVPCIGIMGFLGVKNDLLEATGNKGFIRSKINWLLSNSILRILDTIRDVTNVSEKNVYLLEICLSSFIDLHSSDDLDILQNFKKLNSIEKMTSGLQIFENVVHEISEDNMIRKRRDTNKSGGGGNDDLEAILADLEETILNSRSFLEYKSNYCR